MATLAPIKITTPEDVNPELRALRARRDKTAAKATEAQREHRIVLDGKGRFDPSRIAAAKTACAEAEVAARAYAEARMAAAPVAAAQLVASAEFKAALQAAAVEVAKSNTAMIALLHTLEEAGRAGLTIGSTLHPPLELVAPLQRFRAWVVRVGIDVSALPSPAREWIGAVVPKEDA